MHKSGRVKRKNRVKSQRKYWIRPGKSHEYWNGFAKYDGLPDEWKDNFRMSKESFNILCDELRPGIMKNTTQMCKTIDVEKQVAVAKLYCPAGAGRMRKTANAFGIAKCTVSKIIYRVKKAINIFGTKVYKASNY